MKFDFSIIIPVYNRPQEIEELLESLTQQDLQDDFEVVIVEDGSKNKADKIVEKYKGKLKIMIYLLDLQKQV